MNRKTLITIEIGERKKVAKEYGLEEESEKTYLPSVPELKGRLENLERYGFSKEEIKVVVRKSPSLLSYTAERINNILTNLERYGFPRDDIKIMVRRMPSLLGYNLKRTNNFLTNLERYGFSREDIIFMVRRLPSLLGYTAERIGKTIEWFKQNQINIDLTKKPGRLIFSLKTLEERRQALERTSFNYQQNPNPLFYSKKKWKSFWGKNN